MRHFHILAIVVASVLLGLSSCKSQYDALLSSNDVDAKYKAAFEYFNQAKYQKAATMFESLSVYVSSLPQEDTVMYYWGLSNYRFKDYFTAEANLKKFIDTYPRSPFAMDARFLRLDCLYRQTLRYELDAAPTYTCIAAINEFLVDFPDNEYYSDCQAMLNDLGERLDRKAYEAAKLYYKMEDYKASRVALRNVLRDDADNYYREDILYYIAMSSYKYASLSVPSKQKERYLTFMDDYLNFIGEAPESPYRRQLTSLYARAQKAVGNYTGADEDLESEKDIEKERKALQKSVKAEQKASLKRVKEEEKAEKKAAKESAKEKAES